MEEKWKRMLFYICALLFVMVVYIGMIEQKTKERLLSASREAADMSEALQAQGEEKDTGPGGTEDTEEIRTASAGASGETEAQKETEAQGETETRKETETQQESEAQGETETQKGTEVQGVTEVSQAGQKTETGKEGGLTIDDCGENPSIRVLICSDNYSFDYHSAVSIGCTSDFILEIVRLVRISKY